MLATTDERPGARPERLRPDRCEFLGALDLESDVIQAGRICCDQLQLMVLPVRRQSDLTFGSRPLAQPGQIAPINDAQCIMRSLCPSPLLRDPESAW
jgi:hypothetical protein